MKTKAVPSTMTRINQARLKQNRKYLAFRCVEDPRTRYLDWDEEGVGFLGALLEGILVHVSLDGIPWIISTELLFNRSLMWKLWNKRGCALLRVLGSSTRGLYALHAISTSEKFPARSHPPQSPPPQDQRHQKVLILPNFHAILHQSIPFSPVESKP